MKAFIALGSNLDNPRAQIERAVQAIATFPTSELLNISPFYETSPMGYADQDAFVNAVVCIETQLQPLELLTWLQRIEQAQGRVRKIKNGPRTIDCDLILMGTIVLETPTLTLPHPGLLSRDFVLKPLLDIAPDCALPDGRLVSPFLEAVTTRYLPSP